MEPFSVEFEYRNGELYCEDMRAVDIAKRFGTPLYVYSETALRRNYASLKGSFANVDARVCFSVKSNSNLSVLQVLNDAGSSFDIVSGGELARLRAVGVDPRQIIFSGVGKTIDELSTALREDILYFNIESEPELELLGSLAAKLNVTARVTMRVNPHVDAKTHRHITTGKSENKFGMDPQTVERLCLKARAYPHLRIEGLHCHIGSQIASPAPYVEAISKVVELSEQISRQGVKLQVLNIGGGFGVPYGSHGEQISDIAQFARVIVPLLKTTGMRIYVEPGRYISATAGVFLSEVLYIKTGEQKNFAIIDGAMNDLMRPALYDAYHPIIPVKQVHTESDTSAYDIVGPVCESADCFGVDRRLGALRSGDLLAVVNTGAYCFPLSSNYNSRPRAAEVMIRGSEARLIRERETIEGMLKPELDNFKCARDFGDRPSSFEKGEPS